MPSLRFAGEPSRLLTLGGLSLIAGAASGLLGTAFRLALERADGFRDSLIAWAHGHQTAGFLALIGLSAAATGLAAWLVRRFSPEATGSGIPHVEAALREAFRGSSLRIIPVKFVGGLMAIGAGLALGREGPSVQMGASLSRLLGKVTGRSEAECRTLLAAGAGAGLSTAFNAPIAGSAFVLEELTRQFDGPITIATLGASAGAIAVARVFLGDSPDFRVEPIPFLATGTIATHLVLGAVAGFLGVAYSRAVLTVHRAASSVHRYPVELRGALIGAATGLVAWFAPGMVGGGDAITQRLLGGMETFAVLAATFALRFALGPISYAARTPGGLFAPMLVLGCQCGLLVSALSARFLDGSATAFAIVGMAAFFTAVVQAPLTGIILAIELTGSVTLLLPMLSACFTAMLVSRLLRSPPIYDALRDDAVAQDSI